MEALGLMPDVVTYTSLMALVVRTGPYRGRTSPAQRWVSATDAPHFVHPSHVLRFTRATELHRRV